VGQTSTNKETVRQNPPLDPPDLVLPPTKANAAYDDDERELKLLSPSESSKRGGGTESFFLFLPRAGENGRERSSL